MVIAKENPIGIDAVIDSIQKQLEKKLSWSNMLAIYPKCYTVFRDNLRTIEHYTSKGEYINMITAEGNKCFFLVSENLEKVDFINYSTEIQLFFTLDLVEIKGGYDRRDSEVHKDVLDALDGIPDGEISRVVTGIERVYDDYTVKITDDLQPYHCFKLIVDIYSFDPNGTNCA